MHIYHAACNVTCIKNHPVLLVCVRRLPLPTHVLCVARRSANSLGNRVEQEPPLVVAVVVRRQLERRAAVERVVRLLLRVQLGTGIKNAGRRERGSGS